jgi:hypothetical protein
MRRKSFTMAAGMALSVLGSVSLLAAPTASAAQPNDNPYFTHYWNVSDVNNGLQGGDWQPCNYLQKEAYTQTAGCSHQVTVTSGFTGGVSIPISDVGGTLSYTITFNIAEGEISTYNVSVPAGGYGPFYAGAEYYYHTVETASQACPLRGSCLAVNYQFNGVQHYFSPTQYYGGVY